MEVQIVGMLSERFNKEKEKWEIHEHRINNVYKIKFNPLNDKFAITDNKRLRYLFLNRHWYRLSMNSYKECRKKNLVGV